MSIDLPGDCPLRVRPQTLYATNIRHYCSVTIRKYASIGEYKRCINECITYERIESYKWRSINGFRRLRIQQKMIELRKICSGMQSKYPRGMVEIQTTVLAVLKRGYQNFTLTIGGDSMPRRTDDAIRIRTN